MKNQLLILFGALILFSCSKDDKIEVKLSEFELISEVYNYEDISVDASYDYWELLYASDVQTEEILYSAGSKCQNAADQEDCMLRMDEINIGWGGFAQGCLPGFCALYIKYQSLDQVGTVSTIPELEDFLGEIDTAADAILLARAHNYWYSDEDLEVGGIKTTSAGYELLVTKLVKTCSPIQENRYLLEVRKDGSVKVLQEEVWSVMNGGCI